MRKLSRTALLLAGVLALAGCRVEVYDKLSQRDANEMTALLLHAGLDAERVTHKDGTFAVAVGEDDFAEAVTLIDRSGLPKPKFASMTDVLSDDRLIASPSEERARLNYALSQELSRTVSDIDGVVIARVHLATPNDDPLTRRRDAKEPTASVAIHHRADLATGGVVPRIKMLVANAVDGLEYDRVSIALFPTSQAAPNEFTNARPGSEEGASSADSSGWADQLNFQGDEFEDPTPTQPQISSSKPRFQAVTPAGVGNLTISPALAAVLGGGFIVLLLVGHALLRGTRKQKIDDSGDRIRRTRR